MLRFAFLSLLISYFFVCLHYTGRKMVLLKSQPLKIPLLISILHDKQKYFKNLCKKICQNKINMYICIQKTKVKILTFKILYYDYKCRKI